MPLIIEEKPVKKIPSTIADFFKTYPNFKASSKSLTSQELQEVGPKGLLYVGQRELGGTSPDDDNIQIIGSDDATTCHIALLTHTGSGAACIAHFDGCGTMKGFDSMMDVVQELSGDQPGGRLEMNLVGGFIDNSGASEKLSLELLQCLMRHPCEIHLVTACITDHNTVYKDGVPFPVCYGIAFNLKTSRLFKASFSDKGPDQPLRGARHFTGSKEMLNVYNPQGKLLVIGPFTYHQLENVEMWCNIPDDVIRENLSTSPAQEPEHFEAGVRASLLQMLHHPYPMKTMFPGGKSRTYEKQPDGHWKKIDS